MTKCCGFSIEHHPNYDPNHATIIKVHPKPRMENVEQCEVVTVQVREAILGVVGFLLQADDHATLRNPLLMTSMMRGVHTYERGAIWVNIHQLKMGEHPG